MSLTTFLPEESVLAAVTNLMTGTSDETTLQLNNIFRELVKQKSHTKSIMKLLEDDRVDPSFNNNIVLRAACVNGPIELVKLLLVNPKVKVDSDPHLIELASKNGQLDIVKLLLEDTRFNPGIGQNYAMRLASTAGHIDIVKVLLADPRVNPADNSNEAIQFASRYGNLEVVKVLLADNRVNPSDQNFYAIKMAAKHNHMDIVKLLLPRTDVTQISDKKFLDTINEINEPSMIEFVSNYLNNDSSPSLDKLKQSMELHNQFFSQTTEFHYNKLLVKKLYDEQAHYLDVIAKLVPRSSIDGITDEKILATINQSGQTPAPSSSPSPLEKIVDQLREQNISNLRILQTGYSVGYIHKF